MTFDLERLAPEALPRVRLLPIVHERLDLCAVVRAVLDAADPATVAVELPTTLAETATRAVARLPRISLVLSEEEGEPALVWVAVPGDPLVEALRWAAERGRRTLFIDPDVPFEERHRDPVPDPHALWTIGAERYLEELADGLTRAPASAADQAREAGMAHHLQVAATATDGTVLALIGAAHVRRVAERLRTPTAIPFARQRRALVELRHLHPESLTALLRDPPLAHAVYERWRGGEPIEPVGLSATAPVALGLVRAGGLVVARGGDEASRRRRVVDYAAGRLRRTGRATPDRAALGRVLWAVAARAWAAERRSRAATWQRHAYLDFARRYARLVGLLVPGLYEWVVAARGVADDNLAWELFEAARCYPEQDAPAEIPTVRVDGDELDLSTRRVRFRRRFFRVKERRRLVPVRRASRPLDPREWLAGLDGSGLCSYPPEDLVVEDFGTFLRQKAVSVVAAERRISGPFVAGMLEGIDLRETLRHLDDGRIWVREEGRAPGNAGSVVVLFDRDPEGSGYPYLMTWLGEHDQESDMAYYSTTPGDQVVGPGILRAIYGGFLMTVPPGRLDDVWSDPDYAELADKAEVLVAAAIDYSLDPLVVHVAATSPTAAQRQRAAGQGKRLLHVPIGSLSRATLEKLRVVHILAGKERRKGAAVYIG